MKILECGECGAIFKEKDLNGECRACGCSDLIDLYEVEDEIINVALVLKNGAMEKIIAPDNAEIHIFEEQDGREDILYKRFFNSNSKFTNEKIKRFIKNVTAVAEKIKEG